MLPNIVLFQASDSTHTQGLWETNGTASGTFLLTNGPNRNGFSGYTSLPLDLTIFNDQVLFAGRDPNGHYFLFTSDGTAVGTVELTGISGANSAGLFDPPVSADLTVFGNEVLFDGVDNTAGDKGGLWTTSGTAAGTRELTGISGAASTGVSPSDITVFNGEALFNGVDTAGNLGLWTTNGTAAGTQEVTGIVGAATTGIDPTDMVAYNGEVLFNGADAAQW